MSNKEVERMLIMAQVMFPSETEVQQEVKVVKSVQRIKKNREALDNSYVLKTTPLRSCRHDIP